MKHWICSQIGAREHYAIPRALRETGALDSLYTDFWAGPLMRKLKVSKLRSMANRCHPDLFNEDVRSWNARALLWEWNLRRRQSRGGTSDKYEGFIEVGRKFATAVKKSLQGRSLNNTVFFGYDTSSLETLVHLRDRGIPTVLSQIDPSRTEADMVQDEEKLWPGWTLGPTLRPEPYFERREREWAAASRIIVNSEFSRSALIEQGVDPQKIGVVPLCYTPPKGAAPAGDARKPVGPLRVLFLGQVMLRKGIQYLIETARLLPEVKFDVVGPLAISAKARESAPSNLVFHGKASRDATTRWYRESSVFVLPTLSDGFAVTQLEAMAHGLPVIATPNCGDVVTPGHDGYIVPAREPKLLAEAIGHYLQQPELLTIQGLAAMEKAQKFTLRRLTANLLALDSTLTCA